MSNAHEERRNPQPMFAGLALGLLFVAAVPGVGWMWGQLVETMALCIGIALLVYAAAGYIIAVNSRLAVLEQRLAERDRASK